MASFASVDFLERGDGGDHFPISGSQYVGTQHRIPGGSVLIVQKGSARVQLLTTTARTDHAGYLALVGKLGTRGQLTLGAASGTATLVEVGKAVEVLASDIFLVDLTFIGSVSGFGKGAWGHRPFGH